MIMRLRDPEKRKDHRHERYYGTFCWCGFDLSPTACKRRRAERAKAARAGK